MSSPEFYDASLAPYPAWQAGLMIPLWALLGIFMAYGSFVHGFFLSCISAFVGGTMKNVHPKTFANSKPWWSVVFFFNMAMLLCGVIIIWLKYGDGVEAEIQFPRDLGMILATAFAATPIFVFQVGMFLKTIMSDDNVKSKDSAFDGGIFQKVLYAMSVIFWPMIPFSLIVAGDSYNFRFPNIFNINTVGPVVTISFISMCLHWLFFTISRTFMLNTKVKGSGTDKEYIDQDVAIKASVDITNRPYGFYSFLDGCMPEFRVRNHEVMVHMFLVFVGAMMTWNGMTQVLGFTLAAELLPLVFCVLSRSTSRFVWLEFACVTSIVLFQVAAQTVYGFTLHGTSADTTNFPMLLLTLHGSPDTLPLVVPTTLKFFVWFTFALVCYSVYFTNSAFSTLYRKALDGAGKAASAGGKMARDSVSVATGEEEVEET